LRLGLTLRGSFGELRNLGVKIKMKTALVTGISGQDGAYLARFLISKGYRVFGTSRDAQMGEFTNLRKLGIREQINVVSMALNDFRSVLQVLKNTNPDEIYNLAGQSSVGLSFEQPVETLESISIGVLNLLEGIRFTGSSCRIYNAGSSECFGDTRESPANENTLFHPRSPYGTAKAAAFWQVANYREAYKLFCCSGILFNHESPLRPLRFVTQKIVSTACRIANGSRETLELGDISIQRDWGWAPEYVEAMWLMLQKKEPEDYVIATGKKKSLTDFVEHAFTSVGLRWQEHVTSLSELKRPSDISISHGDPSKAQQQLGWKAKFDMQYVVQQMIEAQKLNDR